MHSISHGAARDHPSQSQGRRGTKPLAERVAGDFQELRNLQGLAGNEAVTQLILQRADTLAPAIADIAFNHPHAPSPQTQAGPSPNQPLLKEDRDTLDKDARSNLDECFTNFTKAITDEQLAQRSEAADRAEMLALIFDITTGFLAPGVGKYLGHAVERAGEKLENKAFKAAVKLMDEETIKTLFESAVKVGNNTMKSNYAALSGETDADAFMTNLIVQFQVGIHAIRDHLKHMSDKELIVTVAAYDVDVANLNTYRAAVRELVEQFKEQVHPISENEYYDLEVVERSGTKVYYIGTSVGPRLALVNYREPDYSGPTRYTFRTWISKEMASPAFQKMQQYGGVKFLKQEQVDGLP